MPRSHPALHSAPVRQAPKGMAAAISILVFASTAQAAGDGSGARITDKFAQPAFAELQSAAAATEQQIGALCTTPSAEALAKARGAFAELVSAWGKASVLRFGPLADEHRMERIYFWPDPRGIALRQVQATIAGEDESATSSEKLAQKSAALQGLPALEFALYGSGADDLEGGAAAYRCRFAEAIAGNIASIANELLAGWADGTDFTDAFTAPAADTEPYRSAGEVDAEIVRALSTQLRFVHEAQLLPALGADIGKARGKRAPLWRSELTFVLVTAQLDGVRDLMNAAGYESAVAEETSWVPGAILFEIGTARAALDSIETVPADAFADETARDKIAFAGLTIESAAANITEKLAAALGLIVGFNALDGD